MTFEEALPHLKSGKAIYRKRWKNGWLAIPRGQTTIEKFTGMIHIFEGDTKHHNHARFKYEWGAIKQDLLADDWEVSHALLIFERAVQVLSSGGKVRRIGWNSEYEYIRIIENKIKLKQEGVLFDWVPSPDDLTAKDWEEVINEVE